MAERSPMQDLFDELDNDTRVDLDAESPIPAPQAQEKETVAASKPIPMPDRPEVPGAIPEKKRLADLTGSQVQGFGPRYESEFAPVPRPPQESPMQGIFDELERDRELGFFEGVAGDIAGGFLDAGEMYLRSMRAAPGGPAAGGYDEYTDLDAAIQNVVDFKDQSDLLRPQEREGFSRWFHEGLRSVVASLSTRAPGAAIGMVAGGAAGSVAIPIPLIGTVTGATLGGLIGYLTAGTTVFTMAQYDETLEQARDAGVPREQAEQSAIINAAAEGGFEFLTDLVQTATLGSAGVLTNAGKSTLKNTVREMMAINVKQALKRGSIMAGSEAAAEMATAGVQVDQLNRLGVTDQNFFDASLEAFGPALVAGFMFGGITGTTLRHRTKQVVDAMASAETPQEQRLVYASIVGKDLEKMSPEVAERWSQAASQAILNNEDIPLSQPLEDILGPENVDVDLSGQANPVQTDNLPPESVDPASPQQEPEPVPVSDVDLSQPVEPEPVIPTPAPNIEEPVAEEPEEPVAAEPIEEPAAEPQQEEMITIYDTQGNPLEVPVTAVSEAGTKMVRFPDDVEEPLNDFEHSERDPKSPDYQTGLKGTGIDIDGRKISEFSDEELEAIQTHAIDIAQKARGQGAGYEADRTLTAIRNEVARRDEAQEAIDAAANEAATSQENDLPEPTEAQIEAGNYKKGHIKVAGLDVTIENPAGSTRKGVDDDGNAWERTLNNHYGYIKRTNGADGDQVDVFVGPEATDEKRPVFIVDQYIDDIFDEHKVLVGFENEEQARAAYLSEYEEGWEGLGDITQVTPQEFKSWLNEADLDYPAAQEFDEAAIPAPAYNEGDVDQAANEVEGPEEGDVAPEQEPITEQMEETLQFIEGEGSEETTERLSEVLGYTPESIQAFRDWTERNETEEDPGPMPRLERVQDQFDKKDGFWQQLVSFPDQTVENMSDKEFQAFMDRLERDISEHNKNWSGRADNAYLAFEQGILTKLQAATDAFEYWFSAYSAQQFGRNQDDDTRAAVENLRERFFADLDYSYKEPTEELRIGKQAGTGRTKDHLELDLKLFPNGKFAIGISYWVGTGGKTSGFRYTDVMDGKGYDTREAAIEAGLKDVYSFAETAKTTANEPYPGKQAFMNKILALAKEQGVKVVEEDTTGDVENFDDLRGRLQMFEDRFGRMENGMEHLSHALTYAKQGKQDKTMEHLGYLHDALGTMPVGGGLNSLNRGQWDELNEYVSGIIGRDQHEAPAKKTPPTTQSKMDIVTKAQTFIGSVGLDVAQIRAKAAEEEGDYADYLNHIADQIDKSNATDYVSFGLHRQQVNNPTTAYVGDVIRIDEGEGPQKFMTIRKVYKKNDAILGVEVVMKDAFAIELSYDDFQSSSKVLVVTNVKERFGIDLVDDYRPMDDYLPADEIEGDQEAAVVMGSEEKYISTEAQPSEKQLSNFEEQNAEKMKSAVTIYEGMREKGIDGLPKHEAGFAKQETPAGQAFILRRELQQKIANISKLKAKAERAAAKRKAMGFDVVPIAPMKDQSGKAAKQAAKFIRARGLERDVMRGDDFYLRLERENYDDLVIERHDHETAGQGIYNALFLTHYREQNGDRIITSEMIFRVLDNGKLELTETAVEGPRGEVRGRDATFANMFATNINEQGWADVQVGQEEDVQEDTTDIGTIENIDTVALGRMFQGLHRMPHNKRDVQRLFIDQIRTQTGDLFTTTDLNKAIQNGTLRWRDVEEAYEYALVRAVREEYFNLDNGQFETEDAYATIVEMYENQASISNRTSKTEAQQQFSTPAPIAFAMQQYTGNDGKVYEPTAGNGMLVTGFDPGNVYANELDTGARTAALQDQGFNVTSEDGNTTGIVEDGSMDVVIGNPPFGSAEVIRMDGFPIKKLEHQVVAHALEAMKDNGKAAFIIGGHTEFKNGKMNETDRVFFNYLYSHYNVDGIINIKGDLYRKQGTTFPVRVILINGRKATPDKVFAPKDQAAFPLASDFDQVYDIIVKGEYANVTGSETSIEQDGEQRLPEPGAERDDQVSGDVDQQEPGSSGSGRERGGPGSVRDDGGQRADTDGPESGQGQRQSTEPQSERSSVSKSYGQSNTVFTKERYESAREKLRKKLDQLNSGIDPELFTLAVEVGGFHVEAGARKFADFAKAMVEDMGEKIKPFLKSIYSGIRLDPSMEGIKSEMDSPAVFEDADLDEVLADTQVEDIQHEIIEPKQEVTQADIDNAISSLEGLSPDAQEQFGKVLTPGSPMYQAVQIALGKRPVPKGMDVTGAPAADVTVDELQVQYQPRSKGTAGFSLMPKNMADSISRVMDELEERVGDIDKYVTQELQYDDVDQLYRALSAEQIDAVALAIRAIQNKAAVIVGDMTGFGKGRVVAAVQRYSILQGMKPIFFTEKPTLFSDMWRDVVGIESEDLFKPFLIHSQPSESTIYDQEGNVVQKPIFGRPKVKKQIDEDMDSVFDDYNAIWMPYSQIKDPNKSQRQRAILSRYSHDNVIIMDESHNASGQSNTGEFIRGILQNAAGALYSSATYAKRPETMPLYFRTSLGSTDMSMEELTLAVENGGVPLQQVLAVQLSDAGEYIRRELDYSQVESYQVVVDHDNEQRDNDRADRVTAALREIYKSEQVLNDFVKDRVDEMIASQEGVQGDTADDKSGVNRAPFASTVHHAIGKMLLALKADSTVVHAVEAIKQGRKPVVNLMHTMGSFIDRYVSEFGVSSGEPINVTFNHAIRDAFISNLKITYTNAQGDKINPYTEEVIDEPYQHQISDFPMDIQEVLREVENNIMAADLSDLPASPIDYIYYKVEKELRDQGIKITDQDGNEKEFSAAELTGRNVMLRYRDDGPPILEARGKEQRDRGAAIRGFNNGQHDLVLFNSAGSTGISLHSSQDFADQRQREMIVAQADFNIDTYVQALGRIYRRGQVLPPRYVIPLTALPAELRPAIMLQKKLESLNANISANAEGKNSLEGVEDMFNKYGDQVINELLTQHPDFVNMTGIAPSEDDRPPSGLISKVSGRVAILPSEFQRTFYEELNELYREKIEYLNAIGENDLVADDLDYQAESVSRTVIDVGENESNPFTESVYLERNKVRILKNPLRAEQVQELVDARLEDKSQRQFAYELIADIEARRDAYLELLNNQLSAAEEDVEKNRLEQRIAFVNSSYRDVVREINKFAMGQHYDVKFHNEHETLPGVLINIKYKAPKEGTEANPILPSRFVFEFAVASSIQKVSIKMTQKDLLEQTRLAGRGIPDNWDELTPSEGFEYRYMMTGNLLKASSLKKGQVITYTVAGQDEVSTAIQLPRNMKKEEIDRLTTNLKTTADVAYQYLNEHKRRSVRSTGISNMTILTNETWSDQPTWHVQIPKAKKRSKMFESPAILKYIIGEEFRTSKGTKIGNVEHEDLLEFMRVVSEETDVKWSVDREWMEEKGFAPKDKSPDKPEPTPEPIPTKKGKIREGGKMTAYGVHKAINHAKNQIENPIPINIVKTVTELPQHLQDRVDRAEQSGKGQVSAMYESNENAIYMIADRIQGNEDAQRVFFHEIYGHYGFRKLVGAEANQILDEIWKSRREDITQLVNDYGYDDVTADGRRAAAEEYIATMAEQNRMPSMVQRMVAAIRRLLRNWFPNITWKDSDIRALIARGKVNVQRGSNEAGPGPLGGKRPAFKRTQVLGTPAQVEIRRRRMGQSKQDLTIGQRITETLGKVHRFFNKERFYQGVFDEFARIEALEKLDNEGIILDASLSASKAARLTKNLDSVVAAILMRGAIRYNEDQGGFELVDPENGKGFVEIFEPLVTHADGDLLQLWEGWAMANRAERLLEEGREKNLQPEEIAELQNIPEEYQELFQSVMDDWIDLNRQLLDAAEAVGALNKDERAEWEKNDYVPFYRVMESMLTGELEEKGPQKTGGLVAGKLIKRLSGTDAKTGSILENMVMNIAHIMDTAFSTVAMQRTIEVAERLGAAKRKPKNWAPAFVPDVVMAEALRNGGIIPDEDTAQELFEDTGIQAGIFLDEEEKAHWSKVLRRVAPQGQNIVNVMVDGKVQYYEITDPALLRSLVAMQPRSTDALMKAMKWSKRLLTTAVTVDPAFMIANFLRDSFSTWIVTDAKMIPIMDSMKGWMKAAREDKVLMSMMASGAGGGGFYKTEPESVKKNVRARLRRLDRGTIVDTPFKLARMWMKLGSASESANRIVKYDSTEGSQTEKAYQAMDVLNFTRRGDFNAIRFLIDSVPFMNARLQGLDRLRRGFKEHPMQFAMKGGGLFAASLVLYAINAGNDDYEELPEWDKDTYWHIWIGGEHFRIPKPFEVGAIFGTGAERMAEAVRKERGDIFMRRLGAAFSETFALNPVPQLFKPITEQVANRNFYTWSPIIPLHLQKLAPEAQYEPWTSETTREIGGIIPGLSPKRVEELIRGYTGAAGMYVLGASDWILRESGMYPERPTMTASEIPVVKRFYRHDIPRSTRYYTEFYDMVNEANELYSTIKQYRREGRIADAKELKEENRGQLSVRKRLNRIRDRLRDLNQREKMISIDRSITQDEKRRRIDEIRQIRNNLVKQTEQFNELF